MYSYHPKHYDMFPILISEFDISGYDKESDVIDYLLSNPEGLTVPVLHGDAIRTYDLDLSLIHI